MLKKMNSFKLKSLIIIIVFFFIFLATAVYLFINIQKDHDYDKRVEYYAANTQKIQNFKEIFTQSFVILFEYVSSHDLKKQEQYYRLNHIIDSQFETILHGSMSSSIKKVFINLYQEHSKVKDLADRLFQATNDDEISRIILDTKRYQVKMNETIYKMTDKVYQDSAVVFNERTMNYERLLLWYIGLISFFIVFGFASLMLFYKKNIARPLSEFEKAILAIEDENYNYKINIKSNTEFERLSETFNDMSNKLEILTHRLKEKNDRLEAIVNTPAVGVLILDTGKKVIFENKWAQARFSNSNILSSLKGDKDIDSFCFNRVQDTDFETYVFEDEDSRKSIYECFINKMGNERLLVIFDITIKTKLEENLKHYIENIEEIVGAKTSELNKANSDLEYINRELTKMDEMKTQFLQNISHELRTPLTSIIGYLDVVLNYHNIPPTQRSFLQIALQNGLSLLKIINDLLNITEIESGYVKLHLDKVNIKVMLEEIVSQIKIQAEQKKIEIKLIVDAEVPEKMYSINVEEKRIISVFNNVLSNAIKFTHDGEIVINITADKDAIVTKVTDSGIGIKKEDLEIIFDKFRQVDSSISRAYEGAGLGLPIAKKILELHKSDIKVESEVGKGTTFTVILNKVF